MARCHTEPDPAHDREWEFAGKKVIVLQGKPDQDEATSNSFSQSEYLLYQESQARLRYVPRVQHG